MRTKIYLAIAMGWCCAASALAQDEVLKEAIAAPDGAVKATETVATETASPSEEATAETVPPSERVQNPEDVKNLEKEKESVEGDSAKEAKLSVAEKTPVLVKSAVSKAFEDRLRLATSIGFVRVPRAEEGTYAAGAGGDFAILWDFNNVPSSNLLASIRYAPFHVDVEVKGRNYTGVIEGYHLGFLYMKEAFTSDLMLVAGAELGYLLVSFGSSEKHAIQNKDDDSQLLYTLVTGIEWRMAKKISIGPRIYYGFGNIQVAQFAGSFSFLF